MFPSDLARASELVGESGGDDLSRPSTAALSERVGELCGLLGEVEAELCRTVGEWDARGAWGEEGDAVPASWFVRHHRWARRRGRDLVHTARLARRHAAIGKALAASEIQLAHAALLADAARQGRDELLGDHADTLVEGARALSVDQFAGLTRHWTSYADDELDRYRDPHRGRFLSMSKRHDGRLAGQFLLDAETGALFAAAIERFTRPDPADIAGGQRTMPQLRADAVGEVARRALADANGHIDAAHTVDLVVDADNLDGRADPVGGRCHLDGVAVGVRTAQRHACTHPVRRLVLDANGEVLDLGRRVRLFSAAQRHAMVIRDGGCVWPGCDRPPEWCEAHHLDPFGAGGRTDLDNGALVCRHHHRLTHEGRWRLERDPLGRWEAISPQGRRSRAGPVMPA